MKVALPARGEFGLVVRYTVPAFHALPGPKVASIEPGMECLYPSADEYHYVTRIQDNMRRGTWPAGDRSYVHAVEKELRGLYPGAEIVRPQKGMPEARFVPEPHEVQGVGPVDVVICPRKRSYGRDKNWDRWNWLADALAMRGLRVFAAGAPDSSDAVQCPRAWDHERFLDASVKAIRKARLVVATDAGLAHLAVLCGAPLLLVTHEGKVAPGAVRDPDGRPMEPAYWPVRWKEYYVAANHTGAPMEMIDGWEKPERVVDRAIELLSEEEAA